MSSHSALTDGRPDGHVDLGVLDSLQDDGGGIAIRTVQPQPRGQLRQELKVRDWKMGSLQANSPGYLSSRLLARPRSWEG
jgi:hypothetical protein